MALRADVMLNLIETTLTEPNLTALRGHPGLAWMEPRLAQSGEALRAVLGAAKATDERAALKSEVARLDTEHDRQHRFAWRVLTAWAVHPQPAVAEAVQAAAAALYPEGLAVINVSFRRQVAATEPFAERLNHPAVRAGLAALGPAQPVVEETLAAAVAAGRALGAALKALDAEEVAVALRDPEARVFEVRATAAAEYALLLRNAEAVLARGDKAQVQAYALLLRPWQAAREAARRQNAAGTAADLDALLGTPPPPAGPAPEVDGPA